MRGGVETLSMKVLEKKKKKYYTLECPLVDSMFLVFIPPIKCGVTTLNPS
jgi:hypothetical protein